MIYADFECPRCGFAWERLKTSKLRLGLRYFPVSSRHPRAIAAAAAAEAAGRQHMFWEMVELLFADQGRLDDPHLWARAEQLGLDLDQFDADRRSSEVESLVADSFRDAIRAGVIATPTILVGGELYQGVPDIEDVALWESGRSR
ncbi:MAG: DsbA family protein [Solirubrobacterales bacterium]|nr:DsbA family protein [Solirubrobacterales bacterium]